MLRGLHIQRCLSVQESARILGVSTAASKKDVKEAFLDQAKLYHPDNQVTGDATQFRQLSKAHGVLADVRVEHGKDTSTNSNVQPKYAEGRRGLYIYKPKHRHRIHQRQFHSNLRPEELGKTIIILLAWVALIVFNIKLVKDLISE